MYIQSELQRLCTKKCKTENIPLIDVETNVYNIIIIQSVVHDREYRREIRQLSSAIVADQPWNVKVAGDDERL